MTRTLVTTAVPATATGVAVKNENNDEHKRIPNIDDDHSHTIGTCKSDDMRILRRLGHNRLHGWEEALRTSETSLEHTQTIIAQLHNSGG